MAKRQTDSVSSNEADAPTAARKDGIVVRFARQVERLFHWNRDDAEKFQQVWTRDSPQVQQLADKFFARGRKQGFTARATLILAMGLVGVGIGAFLFPTSFSDVPTSELDSRLDQLRTNLRDLTDQETDTEQQLVTELQIRAGLAPFNEVQKFLFNIGSAEQLTGVAADSQLVLRMDELAELLSALQDLPESFRLDLRSYSFVGNQPKQVVDLTPQSLLAIKTVVESEGINLPGLKLRLKQLRDSIGQSKVDDAVYASTFGDLKKVANEFQGQEDRIAALQRKVNVLGQVATERQRKKEELQQEISQVVAMRELQQAAGINLQSWIPVLSVRVGIVVLLLFLVRILLATYRYSTSLGAFYTSRGDALQWVSRGGAQELLNLKEYQGLVEVLSPDKFRVDAVDSPDQVIAEATKRGGS